VGLRRKVGAGLAVLGVGMFLSACLPPKQPPPPPPPPPPGPELLPPPPDQGPPPNSPTLTTDMNFLTGLNNPWDIAFVPGDANQFFYTQRPGPIRFHVVNPASDNLIVTPSDVAPSGESGMLGMAVDPNFATNHFIYACYTSNAPDNRVVRFHVKSTLDGVDASTPLVTGMDRQSFHDGCRVRFGPGGMLWFTMGDAAVGPDPQDLDSLNGKVARIDPATGKGVSGNPFFGSGSDNHQRIFTYSHRNPQGITFQPGTNQPYSIEHGPDKNDEVNRLVAGGNGGWDPNNGGSYDQTVPMTDLQKFPNAMIPAWRSGDSGTVAPSGGTFLTGPQWKAWENQLVVAFLKDSKARVMFLDGDGNVSFATPILANGVRLRVAVEGPDGNLYITTDVGNNQGAIWKVTPS
jgi:aldose sugar dehydrogenase